jgi:uncharacterized OsmC-like protein
MSTLNEYLAQKRVAYAALKARALAPDAAPRTFGAKVKAEGRSGLRRIRIRDFQVISDSGPDFAGYDLGPTSPELQLGVLGSCITHITLIQAADLGIPLESVEVEVAAELDPRGGKPGFESIPVFPQNIRYTLHIVSPATSEQVSDLLARVEQVCPILNLLKNPQTVTATLDHRQPGETAA